ncbi:MAG: hypothetical protein II453_00795 [Alphaproteobacteria bacterium]|nr:hypothetical protein [Alphaproteobacteria bacterium]
MKNWLAKTNKAYSTLCGEKVTNCDIVITHAVLVGMLLISALAGNIW